MIPTFALVALLAAPQPSTNGGLRWERQIEEAFRKARASSKPIVVDLWADWCSWCKRLDGTTYKDGHVVERLRGFVPLKVDIEGSQKEKMLAMRYGVTSLPTILFLSPSGRQILRVDGFQGPGTFPGTLDRAQELSRQVIEWETTLDRNPKDAAALAGLGTHLFDQEYYDEARELLGSSAHYDSSLPPAVRRHTRMTLAVIENYEREFAEAESLLKEALNLAPTPEDEPKLLFILGRTYVAWGRSSDAQETMQVIIRDHAGSPVAQKARDTLQVLQRPR
jgi:thioredoxin-like negative regulator of GroEL